MDEASTDRSLLGKSEPARFALDAAAAAAAQNVHALRYELRGHTGPIEDLAFSPDSRFAASCSADRTVRIWDLKSGVQAQQLEGHNGRVDCVAFSPDGRYLVSGAADKCVRFWELDTGTAFHVKENLPERVSTITFSPDGKRVLGACMDASVLVWDVASGKELMQRTAGGNHHRARKLTFTTNGASVYFSGGVTGGDFYAWDLSPGKTASLFAQRPGDVRGMAVSRDGRFVAAQYDDRIDVFNVAEQGVVHTLNGHAGPVNMLAFSPDGRLLASVSDDMLVILWNPATGEIVRRFKGHTDLLRRVAYSPDGRTILSGGRDAVVRVWNVPPEAELADQLAVTLDDVPTIGPAITGSPTSASAVANLPSAPETTTAPEAALVTAGDHGIPIETVKAKYEKASTLVSEGNSYGDEFREVLNSIAPTFPTVDVTVGNPQRTFQGGVMSPLPIRLDPRKKRWHKVVLNAEGGGMGAFRFKSPLGKPADMYWIFNCQDGFEGWYITPAEGRMNGFANYTNKQNVDLPGVTLPGENVVYFQELYGGEIKPGKEYYLWFKFDSEEPAEVQLSITLVPAGGPQAGSGAEDVAEMMGFPIPLRYKTTRYTFLEPDEVLERYDFRAVDGLAQLVGKPVQYAPVNAGRIMSGLAFAPHAGNWFAANIPRAVPLGTAALLDLDHRGSPELLSGHDGVVTAVAASPDGRFLATSAIDGGVVLRDASTHEVIRTMLHEFPVHDVAFSPDSSTLLAATGEYSRRAAIALWNPATGEFQGLLTGHADAIRSMSFSADGSVLVTAAGLASDQSCVGEVAVWDFRNRKAKSVFKPFSSGVFKACISPDGQHLAVAGQYPGSPERAGKYILGIKFLDAEKGSGYGYVLAHSLSVQAMRFINDGNALLSAGGDGCVRLWELDHSKPYTRGKHVASWQLHDGPIVGMAVSDDGAQLATIDDKGNIETVALKPKPPASRIAVDLARHRFVTEVMRLGFTPDGKRLFVGADEWGLARWKVGDTFTSDGAATWVPPQWLRDVDFSSHGEKAVLCLTNTGEVTASLIVFDMAAGGTPQPLKEHRRLATCARFTDDGKYMVSGDLSGEVLLWDLAAAKPVPYGRLNGHRTRMHSVAFNHDATLLATSDDTGEVLLWELDGGPGGLSRPPKHHQLLRARSPVSSLQFSPDGNRLIVDSDEVKIVELGTGKVVASLPGVVKVMGRNGPHAALSPDGGLLAIAGGEGKPNEVRVYDAQTGRSTQRIRNIDADVVGAVTFSPSGKRLLTGGRILQCWDVETGRQIPNFSGL